MVEHPAAEIKVLTLIGHFRILQALFRSAELWLPSNQFMSNLIASNSLYLKFVTGKYLGNCHMQHSIFGSQRSSPQNSIVIVLLEVARTKDHLLELWVVRTMLCRSDFGRIRSCQMVLDLLCFPINHHVVGMVFKTFKWSLL